MATEWTDPDFDEPDLDRGYISARTMTQAEVTALPKGRIQGLMAAADRFAAACEKKGIPVLAEEWIVTGSLEDAMASAKPAPRIRASVITPEVLTRVGEALYGHNWRTPLARDLKMSERSVRFMVSGERGIHAGIVKDLLDIVEARGIELAKVAKVLAKALK